MMAVNSEHIDCDSTLECGRNSKKISFKIKKNPSFHRKMLPLAHDDADGKTRKKLAVNRKLSVRNKSDANSVDGKVRAAIRMFEAKSANQSPLSPPKQPPDAAPETVVVNRLLPPAKPADPIPIPEPNASFLWSSTQAVIDSNKYDGYEVMKSPSYEVVNTKENIYETLPSPVLPKRIHEPTLPPRPDLLPPSDIISNCYESIDGGGNQNDDYESIYITHSNRESLISYDQQSNSLYERTSLVQQWTELNAGGNTSCKSELSDKSDDWIDLTDNEGDRDTGSYKIRERHKCNKKTINWTRQMREQWTKLPANFTSDVDDSDHHYESLHHSTTTNATTTTPKTTANQDHQNDSTSYDSFDSDTESELSLDRVNDNGGYDQRLPEIPNGQQTYVLTRLAASASKKIDVIRHTFSLSKSFSRKKSNKRLQKMEVPLVPTPDSTNSERKSFFDKFRRSISMGTEAANELTENLNKPKSTFYLTEIDINNDSGVSLSPVQRHITRPHSPPPPIPVSAGANNTPTRKTWLSEVALFKNLDSDRKSGKTTSWYTEIGLYHNTANSTTPSTSSADTLKSEDYYNIRNTNSCYSDSLLGTLRLEDEPLYQFYDAAVVESVYADSDSSDGYEEVGRKLKSRPSAMELIGGSTAQLFTKTLWCEIPEVTRSAVLSTLDVHQKKLQEAKFEIFTSEASYLNSINVLNDHFIKNLQKSDHLNPIEFDQLFGKIPSVKSSSEQLLNDLEKCWQDNILLPGICDIVRKHADIHFDSYITYCENQIMLDETLKLFREKPGFNECLKRLETNAICQNLTLYSFLMLPMQRITRWPLLIDAVLKRLPPQDLEHSGCKTALATLNKIVHQCNEAARMKERATELQKISERLVFDKNVRPIEIVNDKRWLLRSGNVTHLQPRTDETKLTFGKRFVKTTLHLYLFTDLLLITKFKNEQHFMVLHYCARNLIELNSTDISLPTKDAQSKHLLLLTLLENQNGKTVEFMISCKSETDKERWIEAFLPPKSDDPDETLYECWDCPQVTVIHNYLANQPDELQLNKGDVINVLRKMTDGWYYGEKLLDGQLGWFPGNHTREIANPHVRSKNLKLRHRLLAFSENYLKMK